MVDLSTSPVQETQPERRWKECERQSCDHCPLDSHGHCTDEISGCAYLTRSSPSIAQYGWGRAHAELWVVGSEWLLGTGVHISLQVATNKLPLLFISSGLLL